MSKICTDISQSKILAEILPIKSADMCYIKHSMSNDNTWKYEGMPPMVLCDVPLNEITAEHLPCWSLAALLDVIPSGKALIHDKGNRGYKCICNNIDTYFYDNPIDAAFEMILKLKEKNLL